MRRRTPLFACLVSCFTLAMPVWALAASVAARPGPASAAHAIGPDFSGTWEIDLRDAEQKADGTDCGNAIFVLVQKGDRITGSHMMATSDCVRINEGGEGTVKGVLVGARAVLVVTSSRNGAIVLGIAVLRGSQMDWTAIEEIKAGEPEGDSPLILSHGLLTHISNKIK